MPVQITNLSRSLLTVQLNTGESLHLAPREQSDAIADLEVADNPWLDELRRRRLVSVAPARSGGGAGGATTGRPAPRRGSGTRRGAKGTKRKA